MSNTPDTPFAELLHAVQSNATHITWQKSSPISDRERGDAKKAMKRFLLIIFLTLLMLIDKMSNYFCYFLPRVCSPRNPPQSLADWLLALFWLFFYTALSLNFFIMFKHQRKVANKSIIPIFPRQRNIRFTRHESSPRLAKFHRNRLGKHPPHRQRRRSAPPQPNNYPTPKRQITFSGCLIPAQKAA